MKNANSLISGVSSLIVEKENTEKIGAEETTRTF